MEQSKKKWKHFLSSIIKIVGYSPTQKLEIETNSNIKCLATTVAGQLQKQNQDNVVDTGKQDHCKHLEARKNQTETPTQRNVLQAKDETSVQNADAIFREASAQTDDGTITEVLQTDANESVNEESAQHDDAINTIDEEPQTDEIINHNRDRDRHTTSQKIDIEDSSSAWKVSKIAEYVNFDNCIFEIKMSTTVPSQLNNIYEKVKKSINSLLKVVYGGGLIPENGNSDSIFKKKMISKTSIENGSRLMLDALLIALCSALHLQLDVETNMICNSLPTCRFDYCIRKREHIIGCIEAKSVQKLSTMSIAQAVLQLTVLQAALIEKVEISQFPFFAIVTDGHRFIYIQLKGSALAFEHHQGKLIIRTVNKMEDYKTIIKHIIFLVEEAAVLID